MSAGFVQLEPYIRGKKKIENPNIVTVQKCIRHFDLPKAGKDNSHATFFEMFGSLTLGETSKADLLTEFHDLLVTDLGLDQNRIVLSVFGGDIVCGKHFEKDFIAEQTWKNLGYKAEQIFIGDASNTFWFQGGNNLDDQTKGSPFDERLCGYQTELFYDLQLESCGNNCGPFCDCSRWLEIGNNLDIRYEYIPETNQFNTLKVVSTETVAGVERLLAAKTNKKSIWELDEYSAFFSQCTEFGITDSEQQNIILDRLRALLFLSSEGLPTPGQNGRARIVKKLLRTALSQIYFTGFEKEYISRVIHSLSEELVTVYSKEYPELLDARQDLIKNILEYNDVYEKSILHAKASIKNAILRGEIKSIGKKELFAFRKNLGIPSFLVKKYFSTHIQDK